MKSLLLNARSIAIAGLALASFASCAEVSPSPLPVVVKRTQMHMGTLVTITAVSPDQDVGNRAMQAAFDEIKRLEQLLSTWRSDSELSRVNQAGRPSACPGEF